MPRLPTRASGLLAAGLVALFSHAAFAQPRPKAQRPSAPAAAPADAPRPLGETLEGDAKESYESGRLLFGVGNYEGALIKFQRALELSGDARLLWNVAACEKGLAHYARLIALLEAYRASSSPPIAEADRAEAQKIIELARSFVSALRVDVSVAGARVFVDGLEVGTSPLEAPVPVDIGRREVRVVKAGFREYRGAQVVPGVEPVALRVLLEPEAHRGKLSIDAGPNDRIELDGRHANVWHWEGTVASGAHRVRVSAPGKRAYDTEVIVQDDESRRLRVVLEPERSGAGPWPWVVGGVLAAGGIALTGYLLFKPDDKYGPPLVGNLPPGAVYQPLCLLIFYER